MSVDHTYTGLLQASHSEKRFKWKYIVLTLKTMIHSVSELNNQKPECN